jgi:hypothetical protein
MYPDTDDGVKPQTAIPSHHPSRLFPVPRLATIAAIAIVAFLVYAFLSRRTMQFYASAVFSFYAMTHSMWISVVMLGIFQTLLLIPFRVVNLLKSANVKEFTDKIKETEVKQRQYLLKQSVKRGRRVALYYMVNFFVQLTSYMSIGRLFLTDFYSKPLDPWLLYDFVPYPDYPIQDRWFKIPYPWFAQTADLGTHWVWVVWGVIVALQAVLLLWRGLVAPRLKKTEPAAEEPGVLKTVRGAVSYFAGSTVLFLVLSYILIRNFPTDWSLRIFSGDVAYPNPRFNLVTAIVTFITIIWINLPKIAKKSQLAREAGIEPAVVRITERELFRGKVLDASFVGAGAYFVTNQIPCAFELSVFTLEVISLLSPLTLDQMILGTVKVKPVNQLPVAGNQQAGAQSVGEEKVEGQNPGKDDGRVTDYKRELKGELVINGRQSEGDERREAEKHAAAE